MEALYQTLPDVSTDRTAVVGTSNGSDVDPSSKWVQAFIQRELAATDRPSLPEWKKSLRQTFPLEAFSTNKYEVAPIDAEIAARLKQRRILGAKDKRALNMVSIGHNQRKYCDYVALHGLWLGYMTELMGGVASQSKKGFRRAESDQILNRLLKADLHGAIMKVIRSKCPSYVGIEGIVILETKHTFTLITESNAVKVIPKPNNVFSLGLRDRGLSFTLYGNHFLERTADRSAKKWKRRDTIDL